MRRQIHRVGEVFYSLLRAPLTLRYDIMSVRTRLMLPQLLPAGVTSWRR